MSLRCLCPLAPMTTYKLHPRCTEGVFQSYSRSFWQSRYTEAVCPVKKEKAQKESFPVHVKLIWIRSQLQSFNNFGLNEANYRLRISSTLKQRYYITLSSKPIKKVISLWFLLILCFAFIAKCQQSRTSPNGLYCTFKKRNLLTAHLWFSLSLFLPHPHIYALPTHHPPLCSFLLLSLWGMMHSGALLCQQDWKKSKCRVTQLGVALDWYTLCSMIPNIGFFLELGQTRLPTSDAMQSRFLPD